MRVIAIVGSPRENSNSGILAEAVLSAAAEEGAQTQAFYVKDMKMRGCQGCFACNKEGRCVQEDDMTPLYGEIENADAVIFASPVYMFAMTGQMKLVLDRMFAFIGPDFRSRLPKGKRLGLVFTQASPNENDYGDYFASVGDILHRLGFEKPESIIVGAGLGPPGKAVERKELLASALSLGKRLVR